MWNTRLLACVCALAIAGCRGGGRATSVAPSDRQISAQVALPDWVEIPDWAPNARAGVRPTARQDEPSIILRLEALTWEQGSPGDPHMPTQGYATLPDCKRDDIRALVFEHHPAIGHRADETLGLIQDTWSRTDWMGFVLFAKLLSTSETGAVVQYSLQLPPRASKDAANTPRRTDGTMTLSLAGGTWWARGLECGPDDGPWTVPRSLLMVRLVGLNWPDQPDVRQAASR